MRTDQELLSAIIAGDEPALATLYRSYYQRLCRFLLRMTGDSELVVEVVNDVFLVVWQKAGSFRGDSSVSSWIIGIAYRKALKALKKSRPWSPLEEAPASALVSSDDTVASLELESSLAHLSPQHRAVIELTYFFGYSYREIGEILSCPENTVKTRMFHARRVLQSILEVYTTPSRHPGTDPLVCERHARRTRNGPGVGSYHALSKLCGRSEEGSFPCPQAARAACRVGPSAGVGNLCPERAAGFH